MCWTSKTAIPIIADEDIECFKLVLQDESNTIYSFYNEFIYELNKLYKTEINLVKSFNNKFNNILEGFHSYSNKVKYEINNNFNNTLKLYIFTNKTRINLTNIYSKYSYILTKNISAKLVIANCVIPKGSTYYINENKEIVSNQLIIKSIKEL